MGVTVQTANVAGIPLLMQFPDAIVRRFGQILANCANGKRNRDVVNVGIAQFAVTPTDDDQALVSRWLMCAAKRRIPKLTLETIAECAEQFQPNVSRVRAIPHKGSIVFGFQFSSGGSVNLDNRGVFGVMMASLLSSGYRDNFGYCEKEGCETPYFFDIPKGRPMKKFCTTAHANAVRQKRLRDRQRGKK